MESRRIRQMQLHRSYFIFTISTINYFSYRDVCNVYRITFTISCPVSYLRARTSMCASIARGEKVCEGMPWAPKKSMSEAGRVLNNSNSISLQNDSNCPPNIFYHSTNLSEKQKNLPDIQKGFHDLSGNRTRVSAVRGRRLSRLTNRPYLSFPTTSL